MMHIIRAGTGARVAGLVLASSLLSPSIAAKQPKDQTRGAAAAPEQEAPKELPKRQSPVVVTAQRYGRPAFDLPRSTSAFDSENLHEVRLVRTLPEAIRETPGVSVQKTTHSHGSPKIRGQNGRRTLLLVDGIRVNTSIWRSGNVEYWNTVDAFSLDRLEIVRGPGSVMWGSDAAFGVGQGFSQGPGMPSTWEGDQAMHGRLLFRYASAEDSFIGRAQGDGHSGQFGWHAGVTYKDFGDVTAGADTGRLPETAYDEYDADVKLAYALDESTLLSFGFQHVQWDDAPRTHSTIYSKPWRGTNAGSDFQRDYSNQRDLAYLRLNVDGGDLSQEYTVSYQMFEEEENRIRSNSRRRITAAEVDQFGFAARYVLDLDDSGKLAFGFEGYHEEISSSYIEYNADGSVREERDRGAVADDAYYQSFGLYGEWTAPLGDEFEATVGARYSHYVADADTVAVSGTTVPAGPFHKSWNSLVGSAQIMWRPEQTTRVWASLAQSFRAPNMADLTRFDAARSGEVEVPTTDLDPEEYLTLEVGSRYDDGLRRLGGSVYYMWVQDMIMRFPTGNTIGGDLEVTKANAGDGYFWGFEVEGATTLDFVGLDEWEVYAYADYVDSEVDSYDTGDPGKTHPKGIPPASGQIGFRWQSEARDTRFELFVPIVGSHDKSDYNAAERRDTQRVPPDGLPGYVLFGVRGSTRIHEKVLASMSVENVANVDYRIMDSGSNGLGTNVIFTLIFDL